MNFVPSGAMSVIEAGARLAPRRPSQVPSFARSNNGRCRRAVAVGASAGAARSASPTSLALRSMVGGARPGRRMTPLGGRCLRERALASQHALQQRRGFGQLPRLGQPCGFAERVLIQHRVHLVLSARAALTAGVACRAPSTETEAMVARARSGVTSCAMLARPRR